MSIFSEELKAKRKEEEMTQVETVKGLGAAQSTYVHYGQGSREPDLEMLKAIADISQAIADYLVGRIKE